jgi:hypothetical protein
MTTSGSTGNPRSSVCSSRTFLAYLCLPDAGPSPDLACCEQLFNSSEPSWSRASAFMACICLRSSATRALNLALFAVIALLCVNDFVKILTYWVVQISGTTIMDGESVMEIARSDNVHRSAISKLYSDGCGEIRAAECVAHAPA